jgi:hypothetical protein
MNIAQRGTSFTGITNSGRAWPADRFNVFNQDTTSVYSAAQLTDAPAGFVNSIRAQVTTINATPNGESYIEQIIEANNLEGLAYGAASAQPVTLSFWVKTSIAGVYNVWMFSQSAAKSIGSSFTVTSANTWQFISLTFVGDTAAALATGNGQGIYVRWYLDGPSGLIGPLNSSWSTSNNNRLVSGSVRITATLNATYQITGAQFEVGSTATAFDYRPFGTELALCQRYCEVLSLATGTLAGAGSFIASGVCENATRVQPYYPFKVQKRAGPSVTLSAIGTFGLRSTTSSVVCTSGNFGAPGTAFAQGEFNNGGGGLIAGGAGWLTNHDGNAQIIWSAEL